jgi:hypothetical protein
VWYENLLRRIIEPIPREIKYAEGFSCPSELVDGLSLIETKIRNGDSLTPHLSTRLQDLGYSDPMLNDWGIIHLHLGTDVQASGFVKRTGPLLFARFDDSNAYLIGIFNHGEWSNQKILRTVYENWPETIEQYRLRGVLGTKHHPTDEEIGLLRRGNVNTLLEIKPGVVFAPPGGGFMSDGTSTEVIIRCNNRFRILRSWEDHIKENVDYFLNRIETLTGARIKEMSFSLHFKDGRALIVEKNSKIAFDFQESETVSDGSS